MANKGGTKREKRQARKEQELQASLAAEREAAKRRRILLAVPLVTAALALGLYQSESWRPAAGLVLLVGFLAWLGLALTMVGSSVRARDRTRAGSIDYGKRR